MVLELRQHLNQNTEQESVRDLLHRMRRRADLYTKISDEIDSLLANGGFIPSPSQPPQEEKRKPERISTSLAPKASPAPQIAPTTIKPAGFWGIPILIVAVWFVVSTLVYAFVGRADYFGWLGNGFIQGLPTNLILFVLPGLVMALVFWLYFRGRR